MRDPDPSATSPPVTPPASPTQHPQFDEILEKALSKHALDARLHGDTIRRLVSGDADPRSFVCCNSGCVPCSKDFLRAAEEVLVRVRKAGVGGKRKKRFLFF
ncbi:MAG: hypothetical protein DHS20C15_08050 [Planctomycetota bacterium]|nr:MAG: hypothetical protein DHS20C15_08050 [Planctomycetota bacterium]